MDGSAARSPRPTGKPPVAASTPQVQSDITAGGVATGWSSPAPPRTAEGVRPPLQAGSLLGARYEILQMLGQGGMGAVYKARDRELDRLVAIKVIRPDLAGDPDSLKRFKQELILARQVTHKNVVRIFDLGEAEGYKFITMEYIEGRDVKSILAERAKLAPEEAMGIVEQVCRALDAAHTEGVVHRDLKPQNIMLDKEGKVLVMDFGIARSMETPGLTQTGALVGTPEYMSPEQAKGEDVDARSDLFTLGIIFYQLLTGKTPFQANTIVATLLKRTQERAIPPVKEDPSVPPYLSDVVVKCLEIEPQHRYQSAQEILHDLATRHGPRTRTLRFPRFRTVEEFPTKWVAPALAVVLLLTLGILFRAKIFGPAGKPKSTGPAISLAIVPFRNASGDPSLDWLGPSLAEMLSTDVGQSSYLRTVSADRLQQTFHDLRIEPNSKLDPDTVRHVAEFSNAQTVVWGHYGKFGNQIRIEATLQDFRRDRTAPLKLEAANEAALPETVDRLARAIRENLSLSASVVKELQVQAFKPSSKSIAALRDYNEGLELARQRNDLEARKRLEAATEEDPEFALAYAKLSEVYSLLGYENEAEVASRKAVELSENLPAAEKYRIAASHLRILRDYPKAIEAYENLAKAAPNDTDIQSALAFLYRNSGAYDKARSLYGRRLERDPKSADALFGMGRVEVLSGNLQTALDYLNRALTITIQLENDEEKALILHIVGVAYRKLNKPDEALRNYQESLAIARRLGEKGAMARNLNEMGQLLYGVGKSDEALRNYQDALKLRRDIGDKQGIGETLIDLGNLYNERGDLDQALQRYQESLQIQRDLSDEFSQAICLNNMGNIYLGRGDYQEALTFYQQALQLREKLKVPAEIAETVHNLGEATLRMGQFDQALSQYLRALELYRAAGSKRDAAIESHSTAMVFEYQGRYGAALNAEEEALKVFRGLQGHGFWLGDILSGYGNALSLVGRSGEAQKNLDEALSLARGIKSEPLIAQILNYQGDLSFYRGDLKSARSQYEQALRIATHTSDREKVLVAKINLATVAAGEGRSQQATSALKTLSEQADTLGLKYLSVECSVYLAQALISTKNYTGAQQELQRALDRSEKLGLRMLLAKSHFLLATVLRLKSNNAEAQRHYHEAVRMLDDIRKEPGAERMMERADLKSVYQESSRWSRAAKG
jgi:serine/threonine protein kinase/tetratricopeptide (TPR) repeat protein